MGSLSPGLCDTVTARWSLTDRGLTCRVRPTYVGTRGYTTADGQTVRVLRRSSQVCADAHLETMGRLVGTRQHPSRDGRRVFLSATAEPGTPAPWDPSVELWPHKDYFAATVGDKIEIVDVPRLGRVPEVQATICDAATLKDIRDGAVEVSYGYVSWFVPAAEVPLDDEVVAVGKWKNPATGAVEDFDVEGLVDPTDPRIPEDMRKFIGGNHLAFGLRVGGGRGGPDVRLLLDAAEGKVDDLALPACRAFALQRTVDESGVSGTGIVAVVLASGTDEGPCCALWVTATSSATAYDSLTTMRAIHVDAHADGANELVPLAVGWAAPEGATEILDNDKQPARAEEKKTMADPTPPPNGGTEPPGGDLAAQLKQKTADYDALLLKYNALVAEHEQMKQSMAAEVDKKTAAVAQADALREQLAPLKVRALADARAEAVRLTGAKGELADKLGKATADELPMLAVAAHYDANPGLKSAIDGIDDKLKDAGWCKHRYEILREQGPRRGTNLSVVDGGRAGGAADGFESSFRGKPAEGETLTMQQRLANQQNGGA